jgi:hypothetical protein
MLATMRKIGTPATVEVSTSSAIDANSTLQRRRRSNVATSSRTFRAARSTRWITIMSNGRRLHGFHLGVPRGF